MKQNLLNTINSKIQLSSQRVDLGVVDDIKKDVEALNSYIKIGSDALSIYKAGLKDYSKAEDALKSAKSKLEEAIKSANSDAKNGSTQSARLEKAFKSANSTMAKAEKAAKELGVNTSNITGFSDLNKLAPRAISISSDIDKVVAAINEFLSRNK